MGRSVGVDLHKKSMTACFMETEEKYEIKEYGTNLLGYESFKEQLSEEDEVAVESTGNTGFFVRSIKAKVRKVRVINPWQFKVISNSVKKNDKNDAVTISKYLSKGLLPEVRVRSKEESELASLIATRDNLVKTRTGQKNKIHNIMNANGIALKREMMSSEVGLEEILKIELSEMPSFEIGILVEQIRNLNKAIKKIDEEVKRRGKSQKGHESITSIDGIGEITGTIILNTIGNIDDFENEKKLESYFGIVPRVRDTGESEHHGHITKMGNKIARTALVQSTLIAIKKSPYLREYYFRLKAKKGSGKAIIATARKLLGIIYRTLKNNWVFEDFSKYKLQTNSIVCKTIN